MSVINSLNKWRKKTFTIKYPKVVQTFNENKSRENSKEATLVVKDPKEIETECDETESVNSKDTSLIVKDPNVVDTKSYETVSVNSEDVTFFVEDLSVVETKRDETGSTIRNDAIPFTLPKTVNVVEIAEEVFVEEEFVDPTVVIEHPTYNKRALLKIAETYELEKFKKNAMIIFNHLAIDGYKELRFGTTKDHKALVETFKDLGFEITEHWDLTKSELLKELHKFMYQDFTDYGCVVVVVLTHGSNNGVLKAKDRSYTELEILNYFRTHDKPTLLTKPKILLVQACRGKRSSKGVTATPRGSIRKDSDIENESYFLPTEADILVFHSTYYGSVSLRDVNEGSWFIQTLCSHIKKYSYIMDFESIAMEVRREIAIEKNYEEFNSLTCEDDVVKQMPIMTSSLIRKLYLRKYKDPPELRVADKKKKVKSYLNCFT